MNNNEQDKTVEGLEPKTEGVKCVHCMGLGEWVAPISTIRERDAVKPCEYCNGTGVDPKMITETVERLTLGEIYAQGFVTVGVPGSRDFSTWLLCHICSTEWTDDRGLDCPECKRRAEEAERLGMTERRDCYNCGGGGFSVEGGDCPACKGTGKIMVKVAPVTAKLIDPVAPIDALRVITAKPKTPVTVPDALKTSLTQDLNSLGYFGAESLKTLQADLYLHWTGFGGKTPSTETEEECLGLILTQADCMREWADRIIRTVEGLLK